MYPVQEGAAARAGTAGHDDVVGAHKVCERAPYRAPSSFRSLGDARNRPA